MQRKPPEPPTPNPQDDTVDPVFTLKEAIRLQGMKWLQDRGLQYDSAPDDGDYLHLLSRKDR